MIFALQNGAIGLRYRAHYCYLAKPRTSFFEVATCESVLDSECNSEISLDSKSITLDSKALDSVGLDSAIP